MDFVKIPGATSQSQQIAAMNNNFSQLANESVTKIYNDANGVPNISIGLQPDGSSRIRVAKAGVDVTTASDADLIFNSAQNTLKVVKSGTKTVIVGPTNSYTTVTTTFAHGLGYTPAVQAYVDVVNDIFSPGGGRVQTPYTVYGSTSTSPGTGFLNNQTYSVIGYITVTADSTNIYFNVGTGSVTFYSQLQGTWTFKYYLLQETAN